MMFNNQIRFGVFGLIVSGKYGLLGYIFEYHYVV